MAQMLLPLLPGTLPVNPCYSGEQARLNAFMGVSYAVLEAGSTFYNIGDTKPAVSLQGYLWFRTTDSRWYFFEGVWKSAVNYSTFDRRLFAGTLTDLQTYDGGDTNTPSTVSGPMWVEDTAFAGRSPMGPGAITGSNPAKTLNAGEDFGEGAHIQTTREMARHSHPPKEGFSNFPGYVAVGAPSNYEIEGGSEIELMNSTGEAGEGAAANVVHPVRGIYIIKWSGRAYWTVP